MIFQEPLLAFDPVYTVGRQITEAILRHETISRDEARKRALALFERVRIPSPERRLDNYPHEMSGGMRQRAMIALRAGLPAAGAARRRADDGARRHGADPGAAAPARAAARPRPVDRDRHPRPRRGRGGRRPDRRDVRGQDRRDRHGASGGAEPAPPLHDRPAAQPGGRGARQGLAARDHPGQPAGSREPPAGLPVRAALLPGRGALPPRDAAGRRDRARPPRSPAGGPREASAAYRAGPTPVRAAEPVPA